MPRGGARPGAGRPKKVHVQLPTGIPTPLDYLLQLMNDASADPIRRDRAAIAAAQYVHLRKDQGGKKEAKEDKAKSAASGKFAAAAPPKLVVSNK